LEPRNLVSNPGCKFTDLGFQINFSIFLSSYLLICKKEFIMITTELDYSITRNDVLTNLNKVPRT
jgi:hypothetical protein